MVYFLPDSFRERNRSIVQQREEIRELQDALVEIAEIISEFEREGENGNG